MESVDIPLLRIGAAPPIGRPDRRRCLFQQLRLAMVVMAAIAFAGIAMGGLQRHPLATDIAKPQLSRR